MNKLKTLIPLVSLFFINLISAYSNWGYYSSPLDYLDNEWVRFGTIFLVLFALIFFAISKSMKDNTAVAAIISLGITLLITVSISQQGLLYTYAGDRLGSWITLAAILVALGFFIKIGFENFGGAGLIGSIIISLIIFNMTIDLNEFSFGYAFDYYNFAWLWDSLFTVQGFIVLGLIIIAIVIFSKKKDNDFRFGPFKLSSRN